MLRGEADEPLALRVEWALAAETEGSPIRLGRWTALLVMTGRALRAPRRCRFRREAALFMGGRRGKKIESVLGRPFSTLSMRRWAQRPGTIRVVSRRREIIPLAVRIALRNAVGGAGPYTLREIDDLFNAHEFTDRGQVEDAVGERRTLVEEYHARIDWSDPDSSQLYLDLVADVLDRYPEEDDTPGSPGRNLRRALMQAGFVAPDGRIRVPGAQGVTPEPDVEGIWVPDRLRVFISHVHAVRAEVGDLARFLEGYGCTCFVAHTQIEPSQDWQDVIERALASCHGLVAYVTEEFHASRWTDQEVGWALGRGIPTVPVNAGSQPYGFFGSIQAIQRGQLTAWQLSLPVFRAIAVGSFRAAPARRPQAPDAARAVVRAFCNCGSYDVTRARFPLLEFIPRDLWTREMVAELEQATADNNQISEAFLDQGVPVPQAVRDLIARVRPK
jgi:hypothetical protein